MIRQLVAALNEVGVEIDAEAIADALWLARVRREESQGRGQQSASAMRPVPTEPRPPDAEPLDPVHDTQAESGDHWEPGRPAATSQASSGRSARASSITLRKAHALPGTLELGRALRPLKQGHPSKRHRVLNVDETVEYFCDTGVLTPVMLPGAERWFDVDVLVDVGPSMAVWQDTAAEFVSFLQRHGAFREVRRRNLKQADGRVRLSRAADVRSEAAQLAGPSARRLTMVLTDCIGPMWYQAPIWEAIRGWGLFSPVVVISPLPSRLWPRTALGSPQVTMRSHRPGAANRLLDVTLPRWWPDSERPLSAVPVPVIPLEAGQVATWARMAMGVSGVESTGVFATPPTLPTGKASGRSGNGPPDADERVRRFWVTASPVAYRLAVYLSAVLRGWWGLGLARVLQEAMLPDSDQVHLAEVLVGGLVRQAERTEGQEEPTFEFIDGVADILQRSLTGTEARQVLQAALGIAARLAYYDPANTQWQRGLGAPVAAWDLPTAADDYQEQGREHDGLGQTTPAVEHYEHVLTRPPVRAIVADNSAPRYPEGTAVGTTRYPEGAAVGTSLEGDRVECSVFAPPRISPGSTFLIQAFAHMSSQTQEAIRRAKEFDADSVRRAIKTLESSVSRGTKLSFSLTMPGLQVDDPVQSMVWWGTAESVQFGVTVPSSYRPGNVVGTITVSQGWIPIGHIKFILTVTESPTSGQEPPIRSNSPVGEAARRYEMAFVSYASEDRTSVLQRVQVLPMFGVRTFHDVLNLEPGERWERSLYRHIDESDIVLLFWSSAAKRSKWVRKEVRYALARKHGDDFAAPEIGPVIIEGPPVPSPWKELAHLHFNDRIIYFMDR